MSAGVLGTVRLERATRLARGACATALALYAGATLVASQVSPDGFLWLAGLAFAGLAARPLVRAARGRHDPAEAMPLFLLYFVFAMLLRGVGLASGFVDSPYIRPLGDPLSPGYRLALGWVFLYCALGLIALEAGYGWARARAWGDRWAAAPGGWNAPWRTERMKPAALALIGGGVAAALLRVRMQGGFAAATGDLVSGGTTDALGRFWLIALAELAVVGYHVLVLRLMLGRVPNAGRWSAVLAVAIGVPLYLITSSKFLLLRIMMPPLLYAHFLGHRLKPVHLAMLFAGFGALFPFFYAYRSLGLARLDLLGDYLGTTESPLLKVYNRAYDADSFMIILHRHAEGMPLQWGGSLAELFTCFVPRALWADKPASFGLTFPQRYMPDVDFGGMTYVTASLPGELFLDFHLPGILIGFFLFGIAMRVAWQLVSRRGPGALLAYGYVFLTCVHMVEGSIASQLETLLMGVLPAWLAHRWLRGPIGPPLAPVPANPEVPT